MSDEPRTLDYATEVNADQRAVNALRWTAAGLVMFEVVLRYVFSLQTTGYLLGWAQPPSFFGMNGTSSEWQWLVSSLTFHTLLLACAIALLAGRRWGARVLFWAYLFKCSTAMYGSVLFIREEQLFTEWGFAVVEHLCVLLAYYVRHILLYAPTFLLTTPPMARLMMLR